MGIHEAASCLVKIKRNFLGKENVAGVQRGGETWTGMDSLINNHHRFLPDLVTHALAGVQPQTV